MAQGHVASFAGLLSDLTNVLTSLKKYEANYSSEAKQLLQTTLATAQKAQQDAASMPSSNGIYGYLSAGSKLQSLKASATQLQQSVTSMMSGSIPLPRSSKDELSRLQMALLGVKIEVPAEQQQLLAQMTKLCGELDAQKDVDVIETHLDQTIKRVMQQVHGCEALEEQVLQSEVSDLQTGIQAAKDSSSSEEAQWLSLALNSLQRLHVSHLDEDDDDESDQTEVAEEDLDDDDDDPFFMPMPGAIVWADANKFKDLAAPLGEEQPREKQFMIVMEEDDDSAGTDVPAAAPAFQDSEAGPTDGPEEQPVEANCASDAEPASDVATLTIEDPSEQGRNTEEAAEPTDTSSAANEPKMPSTAAAGDAADSADPSTTNTADTSTALVSAGSTPVPEANPEKLKQFVNFLNGENPGACMFHAQMRLSVDGCVKLANFLKSSARVRALSLSHNYIGDEGLRIICEGLKANSSVTALDLPDNKITDVGVALLADTILSNPSLTQLQLAYNSIGDEGAIALAKFIKTSDSLKKLGLSYNNIGKAGCQALTAAINSNQSLKHLQLLPGNPVEEKDAKALAKALKRNNKFSIRSLLGISKDD